MNEKKARIAKRLELRLKMLSEQLQRTENTLVNDALEFYLDLFEANSMTDDELIAKVKAELPSKDQ